MRWIKMHPDVDLGHLPTFFIDSDPRPAREQIEERYEHGGGWIPQDGFTMENNILRYPKDPPYRPLAMARLRDEVLIFYPYSFLAIVQPDGSFEVARVD